MRGYAEFSQFVRHTFVKEKSEMKGKCPETATTKHRIYISPLRLPSVLSNICNCLRQGLNGYNLSFSCSIKSRPRRTINTSVGLSQVIIADFYPFRNSCTGSVSPQVSVELQRPMVSRILRYRLQKNNNNNHCLLFMTDLLLYSRFMGIIVRLMRMIFLIYVRNVGVATHVI